MHFQRKNLLYTFVLAVVAMTIAGCGNKTKSQNVLISVSPASPTVFTSPITIYKNGVATTITPPWFKFQVAINNQSGEPIDIVLLHIEVTGLGAGNTTTTIPFDFSPSNDSFSDINGTCNYTDYGEFDPGGTPTGTPAVGSITDVNNAGLFEIVDPSSTSSACKVAFPTFYAEGLPLASPQQAAFPYEVKVVPEGYFGTRTTQQDRFTNFTIITTQ